MKTGETLSVASREDWRRWLAEHRQTEKEIWLVFHYKRTGRQTVSYDVAVEEAICYGWIDSQQNRLDDERFVLRFTPRRKRSHWSTSNRERALRMLQAGRMAEAGVALLPDDLLAEWREP